MQRSMGDEVLIAIIAVAVIAFATAFGVILSLVTIEPIAPTVTPNAVLLSTRQPTATINFTPFPTFTRESSATSQPSATDTLTITPTLTETLTATHTPTATFTVIASDTATASATATATDSPTVTLTASPSISPQLSNTSTSTPSQTPTVKSTETPLASTTPTRTPNPTATLTATASPTLTPTATLTLTSTPTRTATQTPTLTHTPTQTLTSTPTRTAIPTMTDTPTQTPTPTATTFLPDTTCEIPERWSRVTIGAGETLDSLAKVAGIPVERLLRRNCLADDYQPMAGDALLMPSESNPASVPTDSVIDCTAPMIASFSTVEVGQTLRGLFEVRGIAGGADFRRYHLDIRPDGYLRFTPIFSGNTPVDGRALGLFDTAGLPTGLAWLRLVIITDNGQGRAGRVCVIPVIIGE